MEDFWQYRAQCKSQLSWGSQRAVSTLEYSEWNALKLLAGPFHQLLDDLPLLGDTTSNQALVFSNPLSYANTTHIEDPTYPNYILPPANISQPSGAPPLPIDVEIYVAPTSSSDVASLPRTGCAIRAATVKDSHKIGAGQTDDNGLWLRDSNGWRWQWLVNGLTPLTNYTTYVIENATKVSGPINFVTKSGMPVVYSSWGHDSREIVRSVVLLPSSALFAVLSQRELRRADRATSLSRHNVHE